MRPRATLKVLSVVVGCLLVAGIGYDFFRPRTPATPAASTPEERMRELWRKAGGNLNDLSAADLAEARRLRASSGSDLGFPVRTPDPAKESRLVAMWKRRGRSWKKLTASEKSELSEYMMRVRSIPEITQGRR